MHGLGASATRTTLAKVRGGFWPKMVLSRDPDALMASRTWLQQEYNKQQCCTGMLLGHEIPQSCISTVSALMQQ